MKKEELNTETAQQAPPIKKRLLSLDALRGITVAGMILVNNAGGKVSYAPLQHSVWNGLTPCDLVFPFFLFIMGISTYISLNKFNFNVIFLCSLIFLFPPVFCNVYNFSVYNLQYPVCIFRLTSIMRDHDKRSFLLSYESLHQAHHILRRM